MKQYWVIKDHLDGGLYLKPEDTPEEELREVEVYCESCGDHDSIIGQFSNWKQLICLSTKKWMRQLWYKAYNAILHSNENKQAPDTNNFCECISQI